MENEEIDGYRELDAFTVQTINDIKSLERNVAQFWNDVLNSSDADRRELEIAKTHFEDAFMHFVKAVAKPENVW
jgi:hypothetical protein